jgi:hypothetical protein
MEISYNEIQVYKNIYVNGNVILDKDYITTLPLSCIQVPENSDKNGFIVKRNGKFTVDSIESKLEGLQAQHYITNIGNAPYVCLYVSLKNATPDSNNFRHIVNYTLYSDNFLVECTAFDELQNPVEIFGYVYDKHIVLVTTSPSDLTATIVLYKK